MLSKCVNHITKKNFKHIYIDAQISGTTMVLKGHRSIKKRTKKKHNINKFFTSYFLFSVTLNVENKNNYGY